MSIGKKIGLVWVVMLVITFRMAANTKFSSGVLTTLYFVGSFVATIALFVIDAKQESNPKTQPKISIYAKRDFKTQNIIGYAVDVTECTPHNRRALKITENQNYNIKFHPEETVFTAATVGGITTGGIHTTKAHHTYTTSRAGKYNLCYTRTCVEAVLNNSIPDHPPYKIDEINLLSPKLVQEAANTPIVNEFLEGKKLVLRKMSKAQAEKIMSSINTQNSTLQMNVLMDVGANIGISKDSATAILEWLCRG